MQSGGAAGASPPNPGQTANPPASTPVAGYCRLEEPLLSTLAPSLPSCRTRGASGERQDRDGDRDGDRARGGARAQVCRAARARQRAPHSRQVSARARGPSPLVTDLGSVKDLGLVKDLGFGEGFGKGACVSSPSCPPRHFCSDTRVQQQGKPIPAFQEELHRA